MNFGQRDILVVLKESITATKSAKQDMNLSSLRNIFIVLGGAFKAFNGLDGCILHTIVI